MMLTLRHVAPVKVHHIWDVIGLQGNKSMDLKTYMSSLNSDLIHDSRHELRLAVSDGLLMLEVVQNERREETEIYKLPELANWDKGDHDWYCFQCHLGGQIVECDKCPRVYHVECLSDDRKPQKDCFVCPACHIVATKPSSQTVMVEQSTLNKLITFIVLRFKSWQISILDRAEGRTWAFAANREASEAWRFGCLVYTPMDLEIMMTKATNGKYESLEEFHVDCKTLVHAIGVRARFNST